MINDASGKMATVVCEINRALASRRPLGIECTQAHTNTEPATL